MSKYLTVLCEHFGRRYEMEATARVLIVVLEAVSELPGVQVRLQPEIAQLHSTCTDFYFVVQDQDEKPVLIMKVKRYDISTFIRQQQDATAQVLREVHIVLTEDKSVSELPFILTNSHLWGFGVATREGSKIRVTAISDLLVDLDRVETAGTLVDKIRSLIQKGLPQ